MNIPGAQNLQPVTQKGMQLLEFDGKYYKRNSVRGNTWYLVCDCCGEGTAKLNTATGVYSHGDVVHAPGCHVDRTKYAKRTILDVATEHYASDPHVRPMQATAHGRGVYEAIHGAGNIAGNVNISQSSFKRARARNLPNPPHTYAQIPFAEDFPDQLCYVKDAENVEKPFLMVNQEIDVPGVPHARILGFSTNEDLRRLALADKIFLDGTFKVTPAPFYQLFTVNSLTTLDENRSVLFPRVYFLLPNKTGATYQQAMQIVLDLIAQAHDDAGTPDAPIRWTHVSCDFESGLLQAIPTLNTNPDAPPIIVDGCHYHFCSNVFKKATTGPFSMMDAYHNPDNLLRIFLQYLYALPMVRENEMHGTFLDIVDRHCPPELFGTARMNHFLEYFVNTWIVNDTYRRACNCFDRPDHRTNNQLEGWHSKLNGIVRQHQNLWRFLTKLRELHRENLQQEQNVLTHLNAAVAIRSAAVRKKEEAMNQARNLYIAGHYLNSIDYLDVIRLRMGNLL